MRRERHELFVKKPDSAAGEYVSSILCQLKLVDDSYYSCKIDKSIYRRQRLEKEMLETSQKH